MLSRYIGVLLVAATVAVSAAQAPAPQAAPQPAWSVTTDIQSPESVYFDAASNALFVSNINGEILVKDGNGYISRLTPDGKVVNAKWVTGLNAPKGLRAYRGTLWVTDIDEVVAIDIASGKITSRVKVDGAAFLNDLATAADGTVYASDSQVYKIYAVKDGKSSVFVEGGDVVEIPNGLLVDGNRLLLGTVGAAPTAPRGEGAARAGTPAAPVRGGAAPGRGPAPASAGPADTGHLYAFDLKTKVRTRVTMQPVGGIDGVELDGSGGLILSDVVGGHILQVSPAGAVRVLRQIPGPADIAYIVAKKLVVVPHLRDNKVAAYDLSDVMR